MSNLLTCDTVSASKFTVESEATGLQEAKQKDKHETSCVKYVCDSVIGYMQPYGYKMDMPTLEVTCL